MSSFYFCVHFTSIALRYFAIISHFDGTFFNGSTHPYMFISPCNNNCLCLYERQNHGLKAKSVDVYFIPNSVKEKLFGHLLGHLNVLNDSVRQRNEKSPFKV